MKKEVANKDLIDFCKCLNGKYFIVYGTCLGAHRETDIMSHDLDIDVGIMAKDFELKMVNDLIKSGFELIRVFGSLHIGFELSFKKPGGVKIDLMFFYKEDKKIWNALWDNNGQNGLSDMIVHSYDEKLFELEELLISNNTHYGLGRKYLERVYGVDWQTPVTVWNWRTDHKCIDYNLKINLLNKYGK